jgi:hypothetical protein
MKKLILLLIPIFIGNTLFSQNHYKKITYYDNGVKKEVLNYTDNYLNGVCKMWNEEGVMVGKVHYFNGKKHGTWLIWHNNGNLAYKFHYNQNEKIGVWKIYDDNGNKFDQKKYIVNKIFSNNCIITFGTSNLSDLSLEFVKRVKKHQSFAIGMEYGTYIIDYELNKHDEHKKFEEHNVLFIAGMYSNDILLFGKTGLTIEKNGNMKFNYGIEISFPFDSSMKVIPCVGGSVTKNSELQLKFGLCF